MLLALWTWRTGEWNEFQPAVFRPLPPPMDVPIFDYNRQRREDDSLLLLLL
jgi:hypothetical protein